MRTKIHILDINKNTDYIDISIVFSINPKDFYYKLFLQNTLPFKKISYVCTTDDYAQYLVENYVQNYLSVDEVSSINNASKGIVLYAYNSSNPYGKLLGSCRHNLLQINKDDYLTLNEEGYFVYEQVIDNTHTTRGVLQDLQLVFEDKEVNTGTTLECWLYRAIKTLDLHWN